MAERADSKIGNDEVSGQMKAILCQPCLNKDKQSKAEKFCSTCDEFQCMDCSQGHYTFAYMKGHNLVNVNEAERNQVSFDMKGLDKCNQHQKFIEFFCEDHSQLCCSNCAIFIHRKCNRDVDIQEIVAKSASKRSGLKVKLQEVKQKAEQIVKSVVSSKVILDRDVKQIPVKIRRMRDEVNKMFDELEVSVVKDAESFKTETLEQLTKKQSHTENYLANTQYCLETIDNVYQNGTLVQQFIVQEQMQKEVKILHTKVDAECQDLETLTITFDFDDTLKLPPRPIIDYVPGQLNVKSHLSEAASAISTGITTIKFKQMISIDLKQSKDDIQEPFYTGIDFLPDGRLVVVDNENRKCLVYNEKFEKVGAYKLSYHPLSVAAVSEQEVAITTDSECKLDILRVNKSKYITLDRSYKMTTEYESISLKDSGHFVVGTIDHSTPFRMLTFTGEEKDFSINFPNKKISYSACTYIRNNDKVVLTDMNEHTVYIYDIKTNTRIVVKDDQIKEPCSAAVGPSDIILVCCQGTNTIVQISQTGRVLSSDKIDIKNPIRICVSPDKSFLVVTNACEEDKKLQKLKISF